MYLRELEEGSLERATIMDRVASRALQVGAWAGLGLGISTGRDGGGDAPGSACRSLGCRWDQAGWHPRDLALLPSHPAQSLDPVRCLSQGILLWHLSPPRV